MIDAKNVLGTELQSCCRFPMTGFFRDGLCRTCEDDVGQHTVCIKITAKFLQYSKRVGNDLSTPHPEMDFPGLIPGDQWCLCASRWMQAYEAGHAPPVLLEATEESALQIIPLDALKKFAISSESMFNI